MSGGKGGGSGTGARLGKTLEKGFSSATKKGLDATMMFVTFSTLLFSLVRDEANEIRCVLDFCS